MDSFIRNLIIRYALMLRSLWLLSPVFAPLLFSSFHAGGIKDPAHNMVAYSRQILYSSASYYHNRVFLKIVTFSGDVGSNFHTVSQPHAGNLSQRRVRFFRRSSSNPCADPTLEWSPVLYRLIFKHIKPACQSRRSRLMLRLPPRTFY